MGLNVSPSFVSDLNSKTVHMLNKKTSTFQSYFFITLFVVLLSGNFTAQAQEETESPDTLTQVIDKIQSDLLILNRLKITGYIQAQYQKADTAGIESFAGGNFGKNLDSRFNVRRGRFKLAYTNELSNYVIQVDVTEKGVGIKDAYASFTEPWLQSLTFTGGVFDRPFGYEISYSSGNRESPERSRIFQTLFPGEREVGAKLTVLPVKTSRYYFFKLEGGVFNGSGPTAVEFDSYKDFIGRLSLFKNLNNESISLGLGASYYSGGWRQDTKYIYKLTDVTLADNTTGKGFYKDSTNVGDKVKREYYGVDAQLTFTNNPLGSTILRGEYIAGKQPGIATSSTSPSAQPTADAYLRNVSGGYVYLVQNVLRSRHQLVVKYDWYDPNTKVSGNEIGVAGSNTGAADVKFSTLGIGWIYRWNSNVKITAYYDIVNNETSNAPAAVSKNNTVTTWAKDRNDNVFTLRLQYKF